MALCANFIVTKYTNLDINWILMYLEYVTNNRKTKVGMSVSYSFRLKRIEWNFAQGQVILE